MELIKNEKGYFGFSYESDGGHGNVFISIIKDKNILSSLRRSLFMKKQIEEFPVGLLMVGEYDSNGCINPKINAKFYINKLPDDLFDLSISFYEKERRRGMDRDGNQFDCVIYYEYARINSSLDRGVQCPMTALLISELLDSALEDAKTEEEELEDDSLSSYRGDETETEA